MQTRWLEWPQLSLERFEVWYLWHVACPRKWHQSVPSHVHGSEPKVDSSPKFSANFVLPRALLQLAGWDVGIKQSLEEKWRNGGRGGVPLAHSRRSLTQVKFCPQRLGIHPFIFSPSHGLVYVACTPRKSIGRRLRYPLLKPILPR